MVNIGQINELKIAREVEFGLYLTTDDNKEILLPQRYVTDDMKIGDSLNVFIYCDSEDRLVATTETPKAQVNEFAFLQVKAVNSVGAFLDWGLAKDILVPFREQKVRMQPNRFYTVFIYLDDSTQRIVASAKLDKFLDNTIPNLKVHDSAEIRIVQRTDLGYKVIVNNLFSGLIYHNEIFSPVNIGEVHQAIVKRVRRDGKIDLILGKHIKNRVHDLADEILSYMAENNNETTLNDSSAPEDIKKVFHCSKKDFKKAVGHLLKDNKIAIIENGLKLV